MIIIHKTSREIYISRTNLPGNQFLGHAKHSQSPQRTLRQPERATIQTTLTLRLARVNIAVQEDCTESHPGGTETSGELGVLQASDEGENNCLRHVFEVIGVGALGAVELLGFGLWVRERLVIAQVIDWIGRSQRYA